MSKMENYWEPSGHPPHPVKFESDAPVVNFSYCNEPGLNFSTSAATYSEDDGDYAPGRRGKTSRQDPLSHRIIEKRRRDRMNSCLADLSRLIPPQYMRKGRGRVEKTEIIEMAIKHLRNLQNQECVKREATCTEHYRIGYQDCLSEAAKFLLSERGEDLCYRMVTRLKEHCNEILKGECSKMHCTDASVSASTSSPPRMHYEPPLSQLRDILTSASDIEHSSNDHIDVKDLSFRTGGGNGGGSSAANGSTALPCSNSNSSNGNTPSASTNSHGENGDYDSAARTGPVGHETELELRHIRMRKFSEASNGGDMEHNNNYKFKNYIKQRFSQDNHADDKVGSSSSAVNGDGKACGAHHDSPPSKKRRPSIHIDLDSADNVASPPEKRAVPLDMKVESSERERNGGGGTCSTISTQSTHSTASHNGGGGGSGGNAASRHPPIHSFAVPIFACHTQGYYIPLNIDYETLLPFLGTTDLLNKNFSQMPPLHPISINVNYTPLKPISASHQQFVKPKLESVANGW